MVSVTWRDIISDSQWQSIDSLMKLDLATCVTKAITFSNKRCDKNLGITRK